MSGDATEPLEGWGAILPGQWRSHYYRKGEALCRMIRQQGPLRPDGPWLEDDCGACRQVLIDERNRRDTECDCHKWYYTGDVGDWLHYLPSVRTLRTVREHAADKGLWDRHEPGFDRETLTRLIAEAGGIRHGFALEASARPGQPVMLTDGIHRWERAAELGIPRLPVSVTRIPLETPMTGVGLDFPLDFP